MYTIFETALPALEKSLYPVAGHIQLGAALRLPQSLYNPPESLANSLRERTMQSSTAMPAK